MELNNIGRLRVRNAGDYSLLIFFQVNRAGLLSLTPPISDRLPLPLPIDNESSSRRNANQDV